CDVRDICRTAHHADRGTTDDAVFGKGVARRVFRCPAEEEKSMTDKVAIRQLPTRVPGLDQILGGGLPEFSFNLIVGSPGSGKTTLAHQIMFALATPERRAVYFTVVGEPPLKMRRYQQQYEFFDLDRVGESIRFVSVGQDIANGTLDQLLKRIVEEVEATNPGLV